jgi:hypothetical protein
MMSRKTIEMDEIDNEYLSYKWIILLGISTDEYDINDYFEIEEREIY